ncbi:MAG: DUF554 domain-containing protein [Firmicutes bacterium]|jgi:uncharacterized membrane protein YqgA involved in biofilm formation|nr:DUF554 domain-containing protein [Bacillota bacterium]NBI63292.1 DUF554 domain-containing protein [Clostridiales bacterium]
MIGTIVNTCTILAGSILGSVIKKGIKQQYQDALLNAMGLAAVALGINTLVQNMPRSEFPVLFILSLAAGSLFGYIVDLDKRFQNLTDRFASSSGSNLAQGLSTGIMLFCIGTLSILGPIESALHDNHTFLFTNATLDFVTSMVLASTYGIGICIAAAVLFLWQGGIYLLATCVAASLSTELLTEVSIIGGILIFSSGLSILKIKDLKALNMLPSLFIPVIWFGAKALIAQMI